VDERQRDRILEDAERDRAQIIKAHGWGSSEVHEASDRLKDIQRQTAEAVGLPYAVPIDLGDPWDTGAPLPTLISGSRSFLAYYLNQIDPAWDGTQTPHLRDPVTDRGIGVVEFKRMVSVKMGPPNDKGLPKHPLWKCGLTYYSAHVIKNSPWPEDVRYSSETFSHYFLTFHDETVECLAGDATSTTYPGTLSETVSLLANLSTG
jgi:hypothetical protein